MILLLILGWVGLATAVTLAAAMISSIKTDEERTIDA